MKTRTVVPVVSLVTFIGFLDTHLLIPILSLYLSGMGIGIGMAGLIIGFYSIVNTPANILFGRVVDRFGFKRPLAIGLLGDAVAMFLYTVSRLPVHFFLIRILHGISGGMVGPATMSAIANQAGEHNRARTMSFYGMAIAAATLVGYGLSGFMSSRLGYEAVFWMGSGLLVVGTLLVLAMRGPARAVVAESSDSPGWGWSSLLLLFRRRGLIGPYVTIFAQYFSFGGVVTVLPVYIKSFGLESFHVGMLLAAFAVMFIIVQVPAGNLCDRTGRRGLSILGIILGMISLALLPFFQTFAILAACTSLYGIAYGFIFPSATAMLADATSPEERGMATGIFHALLTAGVAAGAPVMGWIAGLAGAPLGLGLSGMALFIALVVMLVTGRSSSVS